MNFHDWNSKQAPTSRENQDSVQDDAALWSMAQLRDSIEEEAPDLELLEQLTKRQPHGTSAQRLSLGFSLGFSLGLPQRFEGTAKRWPFWFGLALLFSGAAVAAGGGYAWLRGWWISVETDGSIVSQSHLADGTQEMTFDLDDGSTASVRVQATPESESSLERLQARLDRQGSGFQEIEESDEVFGIHEPRAVDPGVVEGARHLYSGRDRAGREAHLFVVDFLDAELAPDDLRAQANTDAFVVVLREDQQTPRAEVVGRLPRWSLTERAEVTVAPLESGGARFRFDEGQERQLVWDWETSAEASLPPSTTLETQDGRVRVQVDGSTGQTKH